MEGLNKADGFFFFWFFFAGKDEEQEQAGAAAPGDHQRVCDESGREDQRCGPGVATYHCEEVGSVTQELHPGKPHMQKTLSDAVIFFLQEFSKGFGTAGLHTFDLLFILSTLSITSPVVNKNVRLIVKIPLFPAVAVKQSP